METPKYWQEEPGKIIDTGKNVLEYYPRAMKLSVAKPSWTNAMGEVKRGKTVVLDLSAHCRKNGGVRMPRKKSESVQVTIEIDRGTYEQIEQQSANWGETVTDWLMEAVQEKL